MIKTTVYISGAGRETGTLLQEYLQERKVWDRGGPAAVCYGVDGAVKRGPVLNAACMTDKMDRLEMMGRAGVRTIPWARGHEALKLQFPLYARKVYGMGAKDLMPVFQPEEVPWRIEAGWEWFSSIVPIEREIRCWVWRDEVLQTFEKVMARPSDYKAMGRNFGQGFDFEPVGSRLELSDEAIRATDAISLDFAAIDMIYGKDRRVYVLEANTAAGAIRSGAQATLAKLADRIADWCRADCPRR